MDKRTDNSNAYCSFPTGRGIIIIMSLKIIIIIIHWSESIHLATNESSQYTPVHQATNKSSQYTPYTRPPISHHNTHRCVHQASNESSQYTPVHQATNESSQYTLVHLATNKSKQYTVRMPSQNLYTWPPMSHHNTHLYTRPCCL